MKTKEMLVCALMVGIMGILAQIAIPLGPIPFTMAIMGVFLVAGLLGSRLGAITMLVYILLGAVGVPIFTGGKGGLPVVAGPTGGFLWGYVLATYLIGRLYQRADNLVHNYLRFGLASLAGLGAIYLPGLIQLKFILGVSWLQGLAIGVTPFILPDLLKVALATSVVVPVRQTLQKANLLPEGLEIKNGKPEGKKDAIENY